MFLPSYFSIFLCVMTCLSLTLRKKLLNLPKKMFQCWGFQLKSSSRNMRCKLLQKKFTGKITECSKHLRHIAIEKNILSELNRCIFEIPLKYIKLVIPKILFLLVLWYYSLYWYYTGFNFYFKIM